MIILLIHTGSFWTPRPESSVKVSIARSYPPRFIQAFPGIELSDRMLFVMPQLAPSTDLLHMYKSGRISSEKYTEIYMNELHSNLILSSSITESLCMELTLFSKKIGYDQLQLCCWEPANKFCHRFLVYDMLPDNIKGNRD